MFAATATATAMDADAQVVAGDCIAPDYHFTIDAGRLSYDITDDGQRVGYGLLVRV